MGTISFDEDPYIYYKDIRYSLGRSVEIKKGDGFWLYTKIRCTYDLASIAVTVRLLVDSHELGKKYTSINCHDEVTTVRAYCTADYSGTAKAELWLGDLNNLMETKSSWIIDFPAKKDTKLKCYDKTTDEGVKVTLEAKLEEAAFPYDDIENKYVKFYTATALIGGDYTDANGKAYMDYTPPTAGAFTITAVFTAAGVYNGSKGTCTLTVTEPAKKDTILKCYPKTANVGEKVILQAKLTTTFPLYIDIPSATVTFYVDGIKQGSSITAYNGIAYWSFIPASAGKKTIKAVFEGNEKYNPSNCTDTLTVEELPECDNGVRVTVKDIPPEGLRVQYVLKLLGVWEPWIAAREKTVSTASPTAVLSNLAIGARPIDVRVGVVNIAGDVMSLKQTTAPGVGCADITLFGYLGRKYRTRMTSSPSTPTPGESFELKAHLVINPDTTAGPNMSIQFYEIINGTRQPIGAPRPTDDNGIAHLVQTKEVEGKYTYEAEYVGGDTYAESVTVTVSEKVCPIDISALEECPIVKALQGTVVFTHLDTLRWYRDTKMSPLLVNAYYRLIPITGRIARSSRTARLVVRAISTMSIRRIERKYGHLIPYLRCKQDVKL